MMPACCASSLTSAPKPSRSRSRCRSAQPSRLRAQSLSRQRSRQRKRAERLSAKVRAAKVRAAKKAVSAPYWRNRHTGGGIRSARTLPLPFCLSKKIPIGKVIETNYGNSLGKVYGEVPGGSSGGEPTGGGKRQSGSTAVASAGRPGGGQGRHYCSCPRKSGGAHGAVTCPNTTGARQAP